MFKLPAWPAAWPKPTPIHLVIAAGWVLSVFIVLIAYGLIRAFAPVLAIGVPLWLVLVLLAVVFCAAPYAWHRIGRAVFGALDKQIP